jgi:hypothetical protein
MWKVNLFMNEERKAFIFMFSDLLNSKFVCFPEVNWPKSDKFVMINIYLFLAIYLFIYHFTFIFFIITSKK